MRGKKRQHFSDLCRMCRVPMVLTKIRHIYQKKKIQKCIFALESAFEKIGNPPQSQKLNVKNALFMVVNRSALVTRNQHKNQNLIRVYGYGAMSNNV